MMNDAEEIMSEIYHTLVQIRYPKITTAEAKNVELTILSGENRVSLLSWLLTEKSPLIAAKLQKLKGATLEVELLRYYSQIGICTNKELLLGNCTLQEQLPTLKLLLDFMKCVYIESPNIMHDGKESINNILQDFIDKDTNTMISNVEPKLNYSESIQYFNNLRKYLDEHQKSNSNCDVAKEADFITEYPIQEMGNKSKSSEDDRDSLFNTEMTKFVETFSTIASSSMFTQKTMKNSYSMDTDIKDIHSNFSSLVQFLQAKDEISNANIPQGLNKTNTPLNEIIEDNVIVAEETQNMYAGDY